MNNTNLNELYFKWICSIIFPDERIRNNYMNVLHVLNNTTFEYILALDENRQKDGIDLHYHFSYACKIPYDIIQINFDDTKCSILEMMTALAKRCEDDIMSDLEHGDRTSEWFWIMFSNLGLNNYNDMSWTINSYYEVKNILRKFMFREYNPDGSNGGLFICPNTIYDLRNMQIWDQMGLFMNEIIFLK